MSRNRWLWSGSAVLGAVLCMGSHQPVRAETSAMQAAERFRLGVVGLVHGHVYCFLEDACRRADVEIVGVAEPRQELLDRYGGRHRMPSGILFREHEQMLDRTRPQAVAVFTDTYDHPAVVKACARRGIHVMLEKPLAVSMAHAVQIEGAAGEGGIHVLVNYETTWYPNMQAVLRLAGPSGPLGSLRKIVVHAGHNGPKELGMPHEFLEWLTDPKRNGAGALFDFGCYGACLATCLMDEQRPMTVTAVTQRIKTDPLYQRVDDEATIVLVYPRAQAIIQASWNWPFSRKDLEVYGERGHCLTSGLADFRLRTDQEAEQSVHAEPPEGVPRDALSYLIAVVRGRLTPVGPSSLKVNMIVTEILEAARESAQTGRTVTLRPKPSPAD